jgi:hypothetical protein
VMLLSAREFDKRVDFFSADRWTVILVLIGH